MADNDSTPGDQRLIWRDGQLVSFADATVHVLSHAAHRGSEVFDVLRVVEAHQGPAGLGLRPHVARFHRSMELMGMDHPFELAAMERAVAETVLANPGTGIVKLVAAWTEVAHVATPVTTCPSIFVAALPPGGGYGNRSDDQSGSRPSNAVTEAPVTAQTALMPKMPASILPPSLKVAASYTAGIRSHLDAAAAGYDNVVFRTVDGSLAESTTLGILVVSRGRILAPPLDAVLDSITRRLLIDVAHHAAIPVEVRPVAWDEVTSADELLLTSTNHPIRPIGQLDDLAFDAPGPVTSQLSEQLADVMLGNHPLSVSWLTPLEPLVA